MRRVSVVNRTRGEQLGYSVGLANTWWLRTRGYLWRPPPRTGEGLLLTPCRAVHMFGMTFPLDVLHIDREGRVVAAYPRLRPWRRTAMERRAFHTLELPVGVLEESGTLPGDLVSWRPVEEVPASSPRAMVTAAPGASGPRRKRPSRKTTAEVGGIR